MHNMTTNIMFLQDMNMMNNDRRTMTIKQAPQGAIPQGRQTSLCDATLAVIS